MSQDKKISQDIPVPDLPSSSDGLKKKNSDAQFATLLSSFHFIISPLLRCGDWDDGKNLDRQNFLETTHDFAKCWKGFNAAAVRWSLKTELAGT